MNMTQRWLGLAGVLVMLAGCGPAVSAGTGDSSSSDGTSTGRPMTTTTTTSTTVATVGVDTTAGVGGSGTTSTVDSTGSSSSGSPQDTSTGPGQTDSGSTGDESTSSGGPAFMCPPQGGGQCNSPNDCASNACWIAGPLGGVCSECDEDSDCAFGCHPGNPLDGSCATCCDGSLGCGCETIAACQGGLFCPQVIDIPGILSVSACSECQTDAGCGGQLCSPTYDLAGLAGHFECVDASSQLDGDGCDLQGSGDLQCDSGNCAQATLMGIPILGVCSECNTGADCNSGVCVPAEVQFAGVNLVIVPAMCL